MLIANIYQLSVRSIHLVHFGVKFNSIETKGKSFVTFVYQNMYSLCNNSKPIIMILGSFLYHFVINYIIKDF